MVAARSLVMQELDRQDLTDLLHGAAILGTGGGGDLAEGFGLIDAALDRGHVFRLAQLDEVTPETLVATPYLLGAVSGMPEAERVEYARLPQAETHPLLIATDRLAAHLGRNIDAFVPCEMGGSNTAVPFFVAATRGGFVIDADPAGRAVPEITHSTYYLAGLPAAPVALANAYGEAFLMDHIVDDARVETLARALCVASGHDIAAVDHALSAAELAPAILPGTLSRALRLGQVWRAGRGSPGTMADRLSEAAGGFEAFRGHITACHYETRDGFTLGSVTIADGQKTYEIDYKNENMVGRYRGEIHATIPDLICLIDTDTGAPVINPHAVRGQKVAVMILPAPEPFTSAKGLDCFGPAYLGLDLDFTPAKPI